MNTEIDPAEVANHIIANLEGGMVIARLERSDNAIGDARARLERYLELKVRKPALPEH